MNNGGSHKSVMHALITKFDPFNLGQMLNSFSINNTFELVVLHCYISKIMYSLPYF